MRGMKDCFAYCDCMIVLAGAGEMFLAGGGGGSLKPATQAWLRRKLWHADQLCRKHGEEGYRWSEVMDVVTVSLRVCV